MTIPWNPLDIKAGGTGATTPKSARRALGISEGVSSDNFVSVKDFPFGALGDGVTDDTAAISAAIDFCDPRGPELYVPKGTYLVTSQLTTITGQFSMRGDGRQQSMFLFNPTADAACLKLSNGASTVGNCRIRGIGFKTTDTTHTKIAIDAYDLTTCSFEDLYIFGNGAGVASSPAAGLYWSGGTGSIGIRTHGRDLCAVKGIEIIADYPVYIAANPNSAATICEDMDHWNWENCYLLGSGHYAVTVADGLGFQDVTFGGFQAWVGGTGGFYMNDTRGAPTVASHGITFKNVRGEQCTDANGYWFNINAAFRIGNIGFENVFGASTAQGIKIDRVLKLNLDRVTMATANAKDSLKVTTPDTDSSINMRGCEWQLNSVFTLTNYYPILVSVFNATNFQGPNTAIYTGYNLQSLSTHNKIYPGTDNLTAQSAAGLFAGTGAPNNANGGNGDIYFRSDGGVLTTIYQRRAGAWVGIV